MAMLVSENRSLEDVSKVITLAKLVEEDLMPCSQVFSFAPSLMGQDIKLLEVPPGLAAELAEGSVFTLRGDREDNVVLCTETHTYAVKEAETSNSLLLVPGLSLPSALEKEGERCLTKSSVDGVFYKYLDVTPCQPNLKRLVTLLGEKLYGETSAQEKLMGLTMAQLLDSVQASEEQIRQGLKECEAVRVDGEWYLLDQDYTMKALGYITRFFAENSWQWDCVNKADTVTALADLVPREICRQVFDIYCNPLEGGEVGEYSVDTDKLSRFFGHYLLATGTGTNTRYNLPEFLEMWSNAVPEGVTTSLDQLAGLVLVDDTKEPAVIRRFTEAGLPEGVQERLTVLFAARERWTLVDITPFIAPLATLKLNVIGLLTKYARPLNVGGTKYFCAKHGK